MGMHVGHEQAEEALALDDRFAALAAEHDLLALDHDLLALHGDAGGGHFDRVAVGIGDGGAGTAHLQRVAVGVLDGHRVAGCVERDLRAVLVGQRERAFLVYQQFGGGVVAQVHPFLAGLVLEVEQVAGRCLDDACGGFRAGHFRGRVAGLLPEGAGPDRVGDVAFLELHPYLGVDLGHHEQALVLEAAEGQAGQRPASLGLAQHGRHDQLQSGPVVGVSVVSDEAAVLAAVTGTASRVACWWRGRPSDGSQDLVEHAAAGEIVAEGVAQEGEGLPVTGWRESVFYRIDIVSAAVPRAGAGDADRLAAEQDVAVEAAVEFAGGADAHGLAVGVALSDGAGLVGVGRGGAAQAPVAGSGRRVGAGRGCQAEGLEIGGYGFAGDARSGFRRDFPGDRVGVVCVVRRVEADAVGLLAGIDHDGRLRIEVELHRAEVEHAAADIEFVAVQFGAPLQERDVRAVL